MIGDLQPYSEMKDFGVPWLGHVPAHWAVRPNRALFQEVRVQDRPDEPMLSVTISRGVIRQADLLSDTSKKDSSNLDRSKYKLVEPGDIAYNKMRAWQGAVGASKFRGIVSPAYIVQRPRAGVLPAYMHHLLRTPAFATEAERWSYGISSDQWSLRPEHFRMIYSCLPPVDEQGAIVRFLDWVDRRIGRYIKAKQKLIKLLEEQKQAIIHQAVTRGLNPNAPLKPSGIPWLGDIPTHWEVVKIRHLGSVGNGSTPSRGRPDYWATNGHPWLNSSVVNRSRVDSADQFVTDVALRECHLPQLGPGVLLVAITGQGKTRGKATVLAIPATINQHLAYVELRDHRISPDYLQLVLAAGYLHLRSISDDSGSTKGALTCADLRHLKVPVIPQEEQRQLIERVQQQTGEVERAVATANREIDLLHEYRTRLIADVVTGKLNVREAAANLPPDSDMTRPDDAEAPDDLSDQEAGVEADHDAIPEEAEVAE